MEEVSEKLKSRFCKDCGIPIKLFKEPYFSKRLTLLDDLYDSLEKWSSFESELEKYEDDKDFLDTSDKIMSQMVDSITSSDGYQSFNSEDMNKFSSKTSYSKSNVYKETNIGRKFISIDFEKANFSVLYHYNKEIFRGTSSWEEFVGLFTDSKYFADSKYIRQVVFGKCNSKRLGTYEKYLIYGLVNKIKEADVVDESCIVSVTNDEVVLDVTDCDNIDATFEILKVIAELYEIPTHIGMYTLKDLYKVGYLREFSDGSSDIKCVDVNFVPMVVRSLQGQALREEDMIFMDRDVLCKYLECPISLS